MAARETTLGRREGRGSLAPVDLGRSWRECAAEIVPRTVEAHQAKSEAQHTAVTMKTTEDDRGRFYAHVKQPGRYACWAYDGPKVFWATHGPVTPGQAAFELGGRVLPAGHVVYRKCGGHGCVNHAHLGSTTPPRAGREMARIKKEGPSCRVDGPPLAKSMPPSGPPSAMWAKLGCA